MDRQSALVLFSGGQDSATCLAWALDRFDHVETIGYAYGQRHAVELACREPLLEGLKAIDASWAGKARRTPHSRHSDDRHGLARRR